MALKLGLPFKNRLKASLSVKVTAAVLLSAIAAAMVHITMGYWGEQERTLEILRVHGGTLAKYLSAYVENRMESHEGNDLSLLIEGIHSWEEVGTVRLLDSSGTIRVSADPSEIGQTADLQESDAESIRRFSPAPDVTLIERPGGKIVIRRDLPNRETCHMCHSSEPAVNGYIEIGLSSENLTPLRQQRVGWQVITGIAILTILCLTCVWLIHSLVLRRVERIREVVEQVEAGNLNVRGSDTSTDELGQLSQRFNLTIAELAESRRKLESSHRLELLHFDRLASIGELSTGLAHEIRNPLAAISGALQRILKSQSPDDPHREIIAEVYQQVVRLDEIVRRLLALARPDKLSLQALDVNELVSRTVVIIRDLGDAVGMPGLPPEAIELELAHDLPLIYGDPRLLQQVLINLVLNGLQAQAGDMDSGKQPKVVVTTHGLSSHNEQLERGISCSDESKGEGGRFARCPSGGVNITIRDFGPGLSSEAQKMMFKPFFTTKKEGTGLGLSVAHRIVSEHEGCLFGRNAEGGGAAFVICLPIRMRKPVTDTDPDVYI